MISRAYRHQAITRTNTSTLSIEPVRINFSEIVTRMHSVSWMKMHWIRRNKFQWNCHWNSWLSIYENVIWTGLILGLHPANERRCYFERRISLAGRKSRVSPVWKYVHHFVQASVCWCYSWWRHQMKTLPRYWPIVRGIYLWIPSQRPVRRSLGVSYDLHLNKRLCKQPRRRWFETPSRSLWCHCTVTRLIPCSNCC